MMVEQKKMIGTRKSINPLLLLGIILVICIASIGGYVYWQTSNARIYIEKSEVNAPLIPLSSLQPGILESVFVHEGDLLSQGMTVAVVGNNSIKTKTNGLVVAVQNKPGKLVTSQDVIVTMIDPSELRIIGHIQEDKGLQDIKVGQKVKFTVDAFESKEYQGLVESISPTSRESAIVFSISDKREEKEFDVKVAFNVDNYPELKNGMSAKMWIYK